MRNIEPKMVDYLDRKLKENGLAQESIKTKDARTLFRLALESCVGIRESSGNNDGVMVELIQETCGGSDNEPWCMSLQQTGIAYAEERTGIASQVYVSEHCLTVWNNTPRVCRVVRIPAIGAICIWKHGNTTSGHTGCTITGVELDTSHVYLIEGNTTSGLESGEIVREGGGVYKTYRSTVANGNMRVVGFLKPF